MLKILIKLRNGVRLEEDYTFPQANPLFLIQPWRRGRGKKVVDKGWPRTFREFCPNSVDIVVFQNNNPAASHCRDGANKESMKTTINLPIWMGSVILQPDVRFS